MINQLQDFGDTGTLTLEGRQPAIDSDAYSFVAENGLTVYKMNPHGHVMWSRHLGNGVFANDSTVDAADNLLVTGSRYDYQTSPTNFPIFDFQGFPPWTFALAIGECFGRPAIRLGRMIRLRRMSWP
jgi:hypothetical protein